MFSYQHTVFEETQVVTPEFFWSQFNDPSARYKVQRHREVKQSLGEWQRWAEDKDFKEYDRQQSALRDQKKRTAYLALTTENRVKQWCQWLKQSLPSFMFMGYFDVTENKKGRQGRWRCKKGAQLSGLVVLDVDHLKDDPRKVYDSWTEDQRSDMVFCMKSPGGEGLKVVFKAHREWGNLADNIIEKALQLGQQPDMSGIDISRPCFVSLKEDIYFINEQELFNYENAEFVEKWRDVYRAGGTVYPMNHPQPLPMGRGVETTSAEKETTPLPAREGKGEGLLSYDGWTGTCQELMEEIYREVGLPGSQPEGKPRLSRHTESLARAYDLLVMTGRNKRLVVQMLTSQPWVKAIIDERGEDVSKTVDDADARVQEQERKYGEAVKPKKKTMEAIRRLMKKAGGDSNEDSTLQLDEWGSRIEEMLKDYPCMKESLHGLPPAGYAAGLFASAAFLGTLMTRTWYYFYHRPEERRRLNYCVMIIGDPASGKSFATRLYKLLASPIKVADKVGYDAVNRYKEETRTKGGNKEKPKKPQAIIRDHPARTSNATFIQDMNNAVETVDGEPMHLHMLTFDSELDNATLTQRGGSWIDKSSMELKAFHNEEDGQAYSNLDSISGTFNVYWNFVYTGTPLSLQRKVTERNFGSGLATRLAVIPLPPSGFKMMELKRTSHVDHQADELLKTWAFRLDGVSGELPLWPLVEEAWQWTDERMQIAAFNEDKTEELLLKRVAYYGITIAAPYVLMRHWDEWKAKKTFTIDDTDRSLCRLVMDIQYSCQRHFFGAYAQAYFDNMERDQQACRQRKSKYDQCYERLPEQLTNDDVMRCYSVNSQNGYTILSRLCSQGYIKRIKQGTYKKLKRTLQ